MAEHSGSEMGGGRTASAGTSSRGMGMPMGAGTLMLDSGAHLSETEYNSDAALSARRQGHQRRYSLAGQPVSSPQHPSRRAAMPADSGLAGPSPRHAKGAPGNQSPWGGSNGNGGGVRGGALSPQRSSALRSPNSAGAAGGQGGQGHNPRMGGQGHTHAHGHNQSHGQGHHHSHSHSYSQSYMPSHNPASLGHNRSESIPEGARLMGGPVAYRGDRDSREAIPRRATGQGAGRPGGSSLHAAAAAARERERDRDLGRDAAGSRSSNAVLPEGPDDSDGGMYMTDPDSVSPGMGGRGAPGQGSGQGQGQGAGGGTHSRGVRKVGFRDK